MKKERNLYLMTSILLLILFIGMTFPSLSKAKIVYERDKEAIKTSKFAELLEDTKVHFFEPSVSFQSEDGAETTLQDFREDTLLIYFWATYCNECVESLREIKKINDDMKFKGIKNIKILPISVDYKNAARIKEYLQGKKIDLPIFIDKGRKMLDAFKANEIPATFIINKEGYVINEIKEQVDFGNQLLLEYLSSDEKMVESNSKETIVNEQIIGLENEYVEHQN